MADLFSFDAAMPRADALAGEPVSAFSVAEGGVARVYIENDLPHLDKLFDYAIPVGMEVSAGCSVRVRFAGKLTSAWVVEVADESKFAGKLQPIERIVSSVPVLDAQMLELAKDLAARYGVSTVKLIAAMIPPRHAGAEKKVLQRLADFPANTTSAETSSVPLLESFADYQQGVAFFNTLQQANTVRAVWQLLPGDFPQRDHYQQSAFLHAAATLALSKSNGTVLIMLPTQREVSWCLAGLEKVLGKNSNIRVTSLSSLDSPAARYEKFLLGKSGYYNIMVGTRSLAYQPVQNLIGMLIFDDAEQRHQDQQSPYLSTFDIALRRAHLQKASFIVAAPSPSLQAVALAESGWAGWVLPIPTNLRAKTAVVSVVDDFERARQGSAGKGRLPAFLQTKIRKALLKGSVLVSVPRKGWISIIRCEQCRKTGTCNRCHGPLRVSANQELSCAWCTDPQFAWQCSACESKRWVPAKLGSQRTFEELGRAFPNVKVIHTDSEHPAEELPAHQPTLVVSTPGSEPLVAGGYELVVIMDADAITSRPELWALEEAMRRWTRLLGLARTDGICEVLGLNDPVFAQALIKRDPVAWTLQALEERANVGFYPAKCLLALDGDQTAVAEFLQSLETEVSALDWNSEFNALGTAPRKGPHVPKAFGSHPARVLIRVSWTATRELMQLIRQLQVQRSLKKQGLVTVRVNPRDLL
ncbi:putative primosomal protein N' [Gleimia coleocanis DSM 15436]|uniref:Putative primosomal protein N n=1 Tax=Gleimia coleocanis DSM 15436 TaxID=525245 RepID=C0W1K5_9ACTO|nr:hypothetical protein [Gleimia coleocanis]EEH63371.1 putative primosomal protein N' [Gleimia coleocanis DSM 15436]